MITLVLNYSPPYQLIAGLNSMDSYNPAIVLKVHLVLIIVDLCLIGSLMLSRLASHLNLSSLTGLSGLVVLLDRSDLLNL